MAPGGGDTPPISGGGEGAAAGGGGGVGALVEQLGMSPHQQRAVGLAAWSWFVAGWVATALPYLLDAAGEDASDWTARTSEKERLSTDAKSLILLASEVGGIAGSLLLGCLCDWRGRAFSTTLCTGLLGCSLAGTAFAPNRAVLGALVVATRFLWIGVITATQTLVAEWVPAAWRGFLLVAVHVVWNAGRLAMTVWWAAAPPAERWVTFFSVAAAVPAASAAFLLFAARGSRYESPRYLLLAGDLPRCVAALRAAAASRGAGADPLPAGWEASLRGDPRLSGGGGAPPPARARALLAPALRAVVGLLCLAQFAQGFGSSGLFIWGIEFWKRTGSEGATRPALIAAPVARVAANVALMAGGPARCPIDRCRRAPVMRAGYLGSAAATALLCVMRGAAPVTACMFVNAFFSELVATAGIVYMTEAFPTSVRGSGVGFVGMWAAAGAMASSSLSGEMMGAWTYLPIVVMAAALGAGFVVCLALPPDRVGALEETLAPGPGCGPGREGECEMMLPDSAAGSSGGSSGGGSDTRPAYASCDKLGDGAPLSAPAQ